MCYVSCISSRLVASASSSIQIVWYNELCGRVVAVCLLLVVVPSRDVLRYMHIQSIGSQCLQYYTDRVV